MTALRTLLDDEELPSAEAEALLREELIGTPLLLHFLQELIRHADAESLHRLCHGQTALHEFTARHSPVPGADPVTAAVRGGAALALALTGDPDHLGLALNWLSRTGSAPATPLPPGWIPPPRLATLATALGDRDFGLTAITWARELAGLPATGKVESTVDVLLDRGDSGVHATLRATLHRDLPPALIPDPRGMLLFTADEKFHQGLETAWHNAGGGAHGAVLWSLTHLDGPLEHVRDRSLTAAFTVLLAELRRTGRRLRGPFTVRRLAAGTAVVGGVDEHGHLVPVSGYRNKIAAAAALDRVVVPAGNLTEAREHAVGRQTEVLGADTWAEAARRSRRPNRRVRLRIASLIAVLALAGSAIGGGFWLRAEQRQQVRETAAQVREQAVEYSNGENIGLGLLLAMASDDLAATLGERTGGLEQVANQSSLRRILQPEQGRFEKVALARTGTWALLSTTTGAATLVAANSGDQAWRRPGSGVELPAPGTYVSGLALTDSRAAIATTDRTITVLGNRNRVWTPTGTATIPLPSRAGLLNVERNAAYQLAFTEDDRSLLGYVATAGLFRWDPANPAAAPRRCPAPEDGVALSATEDTALLTTARQVLQIRLSDCARTELLTVPEGTALHGALQQEELLAVATRGSSLLLLKPGKPETLISDRGPHSAVALTVGSDGPQVVAGTGRGVFGWSVRHSAQRFGFGAGGRAASARGIVVHAHDGVAELHDLGQSTAAGASAQLGWVEAAEWAGSTLVLRGGSWVQAISGAGGLGSSQLASLGSYRKFDLPAEVETRELATSRDGPWAGVLFSAKGSSARQLLVWHVETGQRAQVRLPDTQTPNHLAFLDGELHLSYLSGDVRRFRWQDNAWQSTHTRRLPAPVVALDGRDGADRLYAMTSRGVDSRPSVLALRRTDLAVTAETQLEGGTAAVQLEALSDGQVVAGNGAGVITFLTPDLEVRGTHVDGRLGAVLDLTEVPGHRQVIVSGQHRSTTLDQVDRTVRVGPWERGGPFRTAGPSPDGRMLATYARGSFTLALWLLTEPDLRARVCQAVGRDLTPAEWTAHIGPQLDYQPVCPR